MSSIPLPALGIKPVEQPDLLQQFGQIGALKNQQVQGQLQQGQLQQQQLQTQEMQKAAQEDDQIKQILASEPDQNKAIMQIMRVNPQKGFQMRKAYQEYQNADTEGKTKILDNHIKQFQVLGQLAGTVKDEPSKMAAIQQAVDAGALQPDEAQRLASQPFDPSMPQQWQQQAMTAEQQVQAQKDKLAATETNRHNVAMEGDSVKNPTEASLAMMAAKGDKTAEAALQRLDKSKIASRPVVNNQIGGTDAHDIAQAIASGEQPPTLTGLYRNAGPVRAELARMGVPIAKMEMDWNATKKFTSTMNSQQQVRLRQDITTVSDSLDKVESLYSEWKQLAPQSGFKVINKATLAAMKNVPGRAGAVATALDAQIADTTAGLGTIYMGGNSPTDHSLDLAKKSLSSDWNDQTFTEGLKQARLNVGIRQNSILHAVPAGTSDSNTYAPQQNSAPAAQSSGTIFARDPQGKLHQAPAGTALPAGWKQENR